MIEQQSMMDELLKHAVPEHRRFVKDKGRLIISLSPGLQLLRPKEIRQIVAWHFQHPDELFPSREADYRERPIAENFEVPSKVPLQDEDVQFETEPEDAPEVHEFPQDLFDSFLAHVEKTAGKLKSKKKQVQLLRYLAQMLGEHNGTRLNGAIEYYVGPSGECSTRIVSSVITAEINRLSAEAGKKSGKKWTVTLPTVQSALQALLDSIKETDSHSGALRTRMSTTKC